MKKILFALLAIVSINAAAQKKFTITGDVSKIKEPIVQVFLSYTSNGVSTEDSVEVKNGKYAFKGTVVDPVMAYLRAEYKTDTSTTSVRGFSFERDMTTVFIENSAISVANVDSFGNAIVKGSKTHAEYFKLKVSNKDINDKMQSLNNEYGALYEKKDEEGMKKLDAEFKKLDAEMKVRNKQYLQKNTNSIIALYIFNQYAGYDINPDDTEPIFLALSESIRNSAGGKEIQARIETAKKIGIGKMAMDFTQNDTLGNPVTLSSFRGKYLLLDFWASWCGPCRAENPNVVAAFNQYNSKGFDVLSVSLDQPNGKEKWLKAIHDDKLTWTNVSDLKFWNNEVSVMYGIQGIPQNFLIDPQGKIIGKNLRAEALNQKLQEIFK
jgi:peroxiredoxin